MKRMSRMMIVGALMGGGAGIANASDTANNYNCPGDGAVELVLYDTNWNYETFCVPNGPDTITIDLASEEYFTGNPPGVGPVLLPWTGNVNYWTVTNYSAQSFEATFSIPRSRLGIGCSESFTTDQAEYADGCVKNATSLTLSDVIIP